MRYEVDFPDQDGMDRVTVRITALEDSDSDDEVLTLRLIRLERPSLNEGVSYITFADPVPEVTIILEDDDPGAMLAGTLTEDTLNDSMVTVTVVNTEYAGTPGTADFALMTDVPGLTVSGVTRDSSTRATLTLAYEGEDLTADTTLSVTVLASGHTGTDSLTTNELAIIANTVPTFDPATIAAQTYMVGVGIDELTLPTASGGDGALIYTLAPDLPEGLTFDDQGLEITGTPQSLHPETEYTYTVSDSDLDLAASDMDTITFTITVNASPIDGDTEGFVTEDAAVTTATGTLILLGIDFAPQDGTTDREGGLGTYGRFELTAEGVWTYTLDNAASATNALAEDAVETDVFIAVSALDPNVFRSVIIRITGANDAPMADAGQDRDVVSGSTFMLLGSGSDPDTGDLLGYEWEQIEGDAMSLSSTTVATPIFMAPTVTSATDFIFRLTVTDIIGATDSATVTLTVLAPEPPVVSLEVPGSDTLVEGGSTTTLVVNLNVVAPEGGVQVQLDSEQTVPLATPANVTYGLDYNVTLQASTDTACVTNDFNFASATPDTRMSRRVVVPFPAGCLSQTLLVRALEDVDGLDETLAFSLVDGTGYTVTSVSTEASRTLTVTDNEPVVTLLPLRDPSPLVSVENVVAEQNRIAGRRPSSGVCFGDRDGQCYGHRHHCGRGCDPGDRDGNHLAEDIDHAGH